MKKVEKKSEEKELNLNKEKEVKPKKILSRENAQSYNHFMDTYSMNTVPEMSEN